MAAGRACPIAPNNRSAIGAAKAPSRSTASLRPDSPAIPSRAADCCANCLGTMRCRSPAGLAVRRLVVPNVARPAVTTAAAGFATRTGTATGFGLMLGSLGTTHANLVRLRRSVGPGLCHFSGFGATWSPATSWSRIVGDRIECRSAAVTGRVPARFVRGFGCVAPWVASRCRRRRPNPVPLGRVFGTARRDRLGDRGW